jgi:hypothetical protein
MSFRSIVSGIVRNFVGKKIGNIDRRYRQPIYLHSDRWNKKQNGFNLWHQLDEDLNYSFQISTPDDEMPTQIAVKNIGESKIEEISISVVAKKCFDGIYRDYLYNRQERLELIDLDPHEVVKQYLYKIPRDDIWFIKGTNRVITSYQSISIHLLSKKKDGIVQKCRDIASPILCGSRLDDLDRGNWKTKWGKNYNICLLNNLRRDFEWEILGRLDMWFLYSEGGIPLWVKKMTKPFLALILNNFFLNILFWIGLFSGKISLKKYE